MHIPWRAVIADAAQAVLERLGCPYGAQLSVTVTDNAGIRELNRQYRGLDRATDVLSFPLNDFSAPADFAALAERPDAFDPETGELLLGDIVISAEKVISQAEEYGHTRRRELAFLTCHSMLHLCGYDHMTDPERREMEALQEEILSARGYRR